MKKLAGMLLSCTVASSLLSPMSILAEEQNESVSDQTTAVSDSIVKSEDIYRLYNLFTGEHLYTASEPERDQCIRDGWMYEGLGWVGALEGDPVYRVYNPNAKGGDHYYTKNHEEASYLVSLGWKWDFDGDPVFFSYGPVELYVAWNPNAESGTHNYTANRNEQDALLKAGWKNDAIAWYVLSGPEDKEPSSTPLDVLADLGPMDRAPLPFRDLGWVIFQNGRIGYVDKDGKIVAEPKYKEMFFDYFPSNEADVFLFENSYPDGPFIKLPNNVYDPSIDRPGGLGGAIGMDNVMCFDPSNKMIVMTSFIDPLKYEPLKEWSSFNSDRVAVATYPYNTNEFYIWNARTGGVFGPIGFHTLYTFLPLGVYPQQYPQEEYFPNRGLNFEWSILPHDFSSGLGESLDEIYTGKGGYQRRYIYDDKTNQAIVGFERLSVNGMNCISGTVGQSTFVYGQDLNLLYAGDFEDATAPIGDRTVVKTGGTWKVVTLASAKAQVPTIPFNPVVVDHYYKEYKAQKFD